MNGFSVKEMNKIKWCCNPYEDGVVITASVLYDGDVHEINTYITSSEIAFSFKLEYLLQGIQGRVVGAFSREGILYDQTPVFDIDEDKRYKPPTVIEYNFKN